MVKLVSTLPLEGLDVTLGLCRLHVALPDPIHWLAPYTGHEADFSAMMQDLIGVPFPGPGQALGLAGGDVIWTGRDQALLLGVEPPEALRTHGAVTDVSDGWAGLSLTGATSADVLARLTPLDLRMAEGETARSLLGHMNAQFTARADGFEILVMRSMARTAAHEIETAMANVAARATL